MITSSNYWEKVFEELQSQIERNGKEKYLYIAKRYDECVRSIEDRLMSWYGRNSIGNKVSLKQAYRKLPPEQLEAFRALIEFYLRDWNEELGYDLDEEPIEHIEEVSSLDTQDDTTENDVLSDADSWIETLILYQQKEDVTYYESLVIPILNEIEMVSHDTSSILDVLLMITGWAVYDSITEHLKVKAMTKEALTAELLKSWASDGVPLYDRLSANKSKLSSAVKTILVKGFRNEMSVNEVINEVGKTMGIGATAAKRLVVTENTFFNVHSTYLALKQAGYTHYKIVATIDAQTCDDCIAWDGDTYPIEMYEPNVTSPPKHVYCRCRILPIGGMNE